MAKSTTAQKPSKKTRGVSPKITARAQAILNNDRYDEDTHNAISRALATKDPDLAELVGRAERGEIILDLVGEQEKFEKAAALVVQVIDESNAPDWLTGGMLVDIEEARRTKEVPIFKKMKDGSQDWDIKELANLFVLTQRLDLEPRVFANPLHRVASALSELLCNPETPAMLFNAVSGFVCDAMSDKGANKAIYWQPEFLGKLIGFGATVNEEASDAKN